MCGPWALPLAFAVGGLSGGLQYAGAKQAEHAQMRQYNAERARQQQFTQQEQGLFEDSLSRAAGVADPANQAAAAARREAPLVAAVRSAGPADYLPGSSSAAPVVHSAADRAATAQRGDSTALAGALSRLGGFGDQMLDTSIMNSRNAGRIGQIGSFMQGSNAASQTEIQAAANKGAVLRGLGQLAQQVAMAMATGGAGGGASLAKAGALKFPGAMSSGGLGADLFGIPNVGWAG